MEKSKWEMAEIARCRGDGPGARDRQGEANEGGVYFAGIAGGDCDYCDFGGAAFADAFQGQAKGGGDRVHQQFEAIDGGDGDVYRRQPGHVSAESG